MTTLPASPVRLADLIREHVPSTFHVVAIGGNHGPSRVNILASPSARVTLRWDGDAWVHDEANNVRVLLTTAGLVAFLHRSFPGAFDRAAGPETVGED
jgi:hypothetical protein